MTSLHNTILHHVKFKDCKMLGLGFDTCSQFGLFLSFDGCLLNHSSFYTSITTRTRFFYVLEGTISMLIVDKWIEAGKGTFIRIARNTTHTFANRTDKKAGMLNFDIPGGFGRNLPSMVKWFEENE